MAFFKKIFGDSNKTKTPKGFHLLTVDSTAKIGGETVKVTFSIPEELKSIFNFTPGQYINFSITLNGKEHRRSYSICSGPDEMLSVAIKKVKDGVISAWFNNEVTSEMKILATKPEGNFILPGDTDKIVAIAAGSGITPVLSILKSIEKNQGTAALFYGNRSENEILFKSEIDELSSTKSTYFLSREEKEGFISGRISKESFTTLIKANLEILKSDVFFICGPEKMIRDISETLELFGVAKDKIKFELFTTPVLTKSDGHTEDTNFSGKSKFSILVDGTSTTFDLDSKKVILDKAIDEDIDMPYSCKGGVCSSCKGKVLKGDVYMKMNYTLTDKEVEEGYILACQSFPRSEEIVITYD